MGDFVVAAMSDYLENALLDHTLGTSAYTFPSAVYLSLHTASPADDASGAEVSGGSYARQAVTFTAASGTGGSTSNSSAEEFTNMPAATVSHIGIWDALSTGNLLYHGALSASKTVASGDTISVAVAAVTVTLA